MIDELLENGFVESISEIKGIGHRILHGGEIYSESVLIDDEVINNLKFLIKFGPLHMPGEIAGIESMKMLFPEIPQVAVFDTAFHQTMPKENYLYAVPKEWYENYGINTIRWINNGNTKWGIDPAIIEYICKERVLQLQK